MAWKSFATILAFFSFSFLSACTQGPPTASVTASPLAQETSGLSEQINLLATQTQIAVETASAQTLASPVAPANEETAAPANPQVTPMPPSDLLEQVGPFKQVAREEALIAGRVTGLQASPDGSILLLSESGYSRFKNGAWTGYFTEEIGPLVGIDPSGRAWAAARDGSQVAVWENDQWIPYGANEGWAPVPGTRGNPVTTGIVSGSDGDLWLATGFDVRRFDGNRWQVFTPEAMGMPVVGSPDLTSLYTLVPISVTGELWVGRCDWGSSGPDSGGGIRKFNQGIWQEVDPSLSSGCVTSIHEDKEGNIWIGMDTSMLRYSPASSSVEPINFPPAPTGSRFGYVTDLAAGPDGDLWVSLGLCEEAICYGGEQLFHFIDGAWQQFGEPTSAGGQKLLFDSTGQPWVVYGGSVYQVIDNSLQPVAGLVVQAATTGSSGEIWLVAQSSGPPTLWKSEASQ